MMHISSRGAEAPDPLKFGQPTYGHGGTARTDEEVHMATSKARASLDAWLAEAADVLGEQRAFSISPSNHTDAGPDPLPLVPRRGTLTG
jgi:hypothetical protein